MIASTLAGFDVASVSRLRFVPAMGETALANEAGIWESSKTDILRRGRRDAVLGEAVLRMNIGGARLVGVGTEVGVGTGTGTGAALMGRLGADDATARAGNGALGTVSWAVGFDSLTFMAVIRASSSSFSFFLMSRAILSCFRFSSLIVCAASASLSSYASHSVLRCSRVASRSAH